VKLTLPLDVTGGPVYAAGMEDVDDADVEELLTEELLRDDVLEDELLLVVVGHEIETVDVLEIVAAVALKAYSSSLFPAPQYSVPSPGHVKLQSVVVAWILPACNVFPQ
jgi:hypothetical protein